MSSVTWDGYSSISNHALNALQDDALLPICTACGTQYPRSVDSCELDLHHLTLPTTMGRTDHTHLAAC